MKNTIQKGERLKITAATNITSGQAIVVGDSVGVAMSDALAGSEVVLAMNGVYELKKGATTIAVGKKVYLTAGGDITETATGNSLAGISWNNANTSDSTVLVKIG